MNIIKGNLVLLINLCLIYASSAHRILVVMPFGSTSHKNTLVPLISALADRGHQMTFITGKKTDQLQNNANVREIVIDMKVAFTIENKDKNAKTFFERVVEEPFKTRLTFLQNFQGVAESTINSTLTDPQVLEMLDEDRFDLVLISAVAAYLGFPFAWHFKAPFVVISPNVVFGEMMSLMGDSEHTEYVPNLMTSLTDRMSLMERILNTALVHFMNTMTRYYFVPKYQDLLQWYMPDLPPMIELERKTSLIFTNTHPSINYPRASPPGLIEVGAIHCRPAKPLPKYFADFIEASGDDGFLIFGVGSVIQMNEMPLRILDIFKRAFSRLPQRVVWQWKDPDVKSMDLPSNILLSDWLPQQDLLGHPKCRGFLTHGGLLSTQEAVYHGVPVIGLPFVSDQVSNMAKAVADGYATVLSWHDIDEEKLFDALQQILHQPSYETSVKRLQYLLLDQPETPLERAVFWSEYAIRHNGAPSFELGSKNLSCLQRNLIDVYFILVSSALAILSVTFLSVRWVIFKVKTKIM